MLSRAHRSIERFLHLPSFAFRVLALVSLVLLWWVERSRREQGFVECSDPIGELDGQVS